jgi:hypothetical protein
MNLNVRSIRRSPLQSSQFVDRGMACPLASVINVCLLISEMNALDAGKRNAKEPFTPKGKMKYRQQCPSNQST